MTELDRSLKEIADLAMAYDRGFRDGLNAAANEVDCGGPSICKPMTMKDGACIKSVSKECPHDEAEYIRSLVRQSNINPKSLID